MHKRTIYQAATKLIATALIVMLVLNIMPVQPAYAADTGLRSPTGNVNGTGGNGWTNPQNAYTSNNVRATAGNGDFVNYINFGFDGLIPSTDVIDGIEILIEGSTSGRDATVDLSWNNGGGYTTGDPTANFTGTEQIITVGGSADTWGRTWLPNEFNNASFRVRLTATGGGGTLSVDHVQARVYHHALVSYTINASAGGGGTITPSGAISAAGGSNQTFDIVPSATYIVSGVSIDGGASTGRVNHYAFTNVQANRTIAASFDGGWSAPSASANNNGVGNPNNVFSSNDTYADIASTNDLVNYRNFGLAIPNGATIDGIEVAIEGYSTGTRNADVALSWNNGTSITAPFKTTTMPTTTAASEATAILGGAADTWGRTWSSADFANGSFAVRVEGTSGGGSTLYIDQLQVKVYYQLPDNTPPTTTAAPVGGTYNATQNVTLTCDDGAGSG